MKKYRGFQTIKPKVISVAVCKGKEKCRKEKNRRTMYDGRRKVRNVLVYLREVKCMTDYFREVKMCEITRTDHAHGGRDCHGNRDLKMEMNSV